jgi:hypothetical protein
MVYYHKDDLTNYSKNLKLNRVQRKKLAPGTAGTIWSESDAASMMDRTASDMINETRSSGWSANTQSPNRRAHSSSEILRGGHTSNLEGWRSNFRNKNTMRKKAKLTKKNKKKAKQLEDIYGVDARTLAGLNPQSQQQARTGRFLSTTSTLRDTMRSREHLRKMSSKSPTRVSSSELAGGVGTGFGGFKAQ